MIIYGDDSTRSGSDRACVCLNYRLGSYCVRSKEVASFAQFFDEISSKVFLSVRRLFSLVSFSRPKRGAQYRRRLCGFLGPADSPHPLHVPHSSSGSQAAKHGRIPNPCPSRVPVSVLRGFEIVSDVLIPLALFK